MQSPIFDAIHHVSLQTPNATAIKDSNICLSYSELMRLVTGMSKDLTTQDVVGLLLDNSPAWIVLDLACLHLNIPCIPIPSFFSDEQILHTISDSGQNSLITDQSARIEFLLNANSKLILSKTEVDILGKTLTKFTFSATASHLPTDTAKITYTSGTTGNPKGVCLSQEAICKVATSLKQATQAYSSDIHLCLLPLATLLENIAGVYVPLMSGTCVCVLPLAEIGFSGSSKVDFEKMLNAINQAQATTLILTPELLRGLLAICELGFSISTQLRFVAVGGALVAPALLNQAKQYGIPVYEGYGLSECASVVSLNTFQANKQGSVGKPLAHISCRIKKDGEIIVKGCQLLGYTNTEQSLKQDYFATGDIGYLDDDGYLYITGRKKNVFITSFGRNVSPEWVERELTNHPIIFQAAIFGEAKPFNVAVIVTNGSIGMQDLHGISLTINQSLPDYAQVKKWVLASQPFTLENGLATANFRIKRDAIYQQYQTEIDAFYEERLEHVL